MKLIDKAKGFVPKKRSERVFTQEELEVFIALAKEEITLNQASNALNYKHSNTIYVNISKAFMQLYKRGIIEFKPFIKSKTILCKICKKEMLVFENQERDLCSTDCEHKLKSTINEARSLFFRSFRIFLKSSDEKKDSLG
jgi:uncharacterized CHY-type Zn-finger protein